MYRGWPILSRAGAPEQAGPPERGAGGGNLSPLLLERETFFPGSNRVSDRPSFDGKHFTCAADDFVFGEREMR